MTIMKKIALRILLSCIVVNIQQVTFAQVAAVHMKVTVPANTPAGKDVYIAGSFNNWKSGDSLYKLHRDEDGTFSITLPLFDQKHYEYKYTLGSWNSVETNAVDSNIQNRVLVSSNDLSIADRVVAWKEPGTKSEPSAQMLRINAMKDSTVASLKPQLSGMLDILKSYVQNLLRDQPSPRIQRRLNRKAEKKLNHAYQQITQLLWNIMATLTPEQKTSLKKIVSGEEGKKDFLNTFQGGIQKVINEK
jgi:Glycogen recognition site of AMP-activated protein kinase